MCKVPSLFAALLITTGCRVRMAIDGFPAIGESFDPPLPTAGWLALLALLFAWSRGS